MAQTEAVQVHNDTDQSSCSSEEHSAASTEWTGDMISSHPWFETSAYSHYLIAEDDDWPLYYEDADDIVLDLDFPNWHEDPVYGLVGERKKALEIVEKAEPFQESTRQTVVAKEHDPRFRHRRRPDSTKKRAKPRAKSKAPHSFRHLYRMKMS